MAVGAAAGATAGAAIVTAPPASAYDKHVNREASSKAYETRQTPAFKSTVGDKVYTPRQVQETRTTYYQTVYRDRYIPTPVGTSYGSFSEQFMWAMMFNSIFAHNHANDPNYQQWRRDADDRARTDIRVKAQLEDLDRKVNELESAPRDPNYIPKDVPPEVVFHEDALTAPKSSGGGWMGVVISLTIFAMIAALFLIIMFRPRKRFA